MLRTRSAQAVPWWPTATIPVPAACLYGPGADGSGCAGYAVSGPEKPAEAGGTSKQAKFFNIVGKVVGVPVSATATFIDYGMLAPTEEEKRGYWRWTRWFN